MGKSRLLSRALDASDTFHPSASDALTLTVEAVLVSLVSVLLLVSRTRQKSIVSSGLSALVSTLG